MGGRVKRKQIAEHVAAVGAWQTVASVCPLCDREIPPAQQDAHHLIPKSQGGVDTVILHRLCHRQIHALLTETQLARHYSTIDALKRHPELAKFIAWIRSKPTHLRAPIKRSRDKGFL